jgi:hypothetical protein
MGGRATLLEGNHHADLGGEVGRVLRETPAVVQVQEDAGTEVPLDPGDERQLVELVALQNGVDAPASAISQSPQRSPPAIS